MRSSARTRTTILLRSLRRSALGRLLAAGVALPLLAAQLAVLPAGGCSNEPDGGSTTVQGAAIDNTNAVVATDVTPGTGGGPVGAMSGTFNVTADGQASYKIPIWTPAGLHGVEPSLSLGYNSGSGLGAAGVGWGLSGFPLSSITRCRRTIAIDGDAGPVDFTGSVYCLDGRRLLAVTGGFRPERDDGFTMVTFTGSASAPTGFTVLTKDGLVAKYGTTGASRLTGTRRVWSPANPAVFVSSTVTYAWALDTVTDRPIASTGVANQMTVAYTKTVDATNSRYPSPLSFGELVPEHIGYSFGTSGTTDHRRVSFIYQSSTTPRFSFVSGLGLQTTKLLSEIRVEGPNPVARQRLRTYFLHYGPSPTTGRPLLSSVQDCDQFSACTSVNLSYEAGSNNYMLSQNPGLMGPAIEGFFLRDLNGDGKDDVLWMHAGISEANVGDTGFVRYRNSLGNGQFSIDVEPLTATPGQTTFIAVEPIDFNGDNLGDIAVRMIDWRGPGVSWSLTQQDFASNFSTLPEPTGNDRPKLTNFFVSVSGHRGEPPLFFADLDGDGLQETVEKSQTSNLMTGDGVATWLYRRNTTGTLGSRLDTGVVQPSDGSAGYAVDVDGSGRQQLLLPCCGVSPTRYSAISMRHVAPQSGSAVQVTSTTLPAGTTDLTPGDPFHYIMIDVNGDGLPDALRVPNFPAFDSASYKEPSRILWLNTGAGFVQAVGTTATDPAHLIAGTNQPGTYVGDMNQDGLPDLVLLGGNHGANLLVTGGVGLDSFPSTTALLVPPTAGMTAVDTAGNSLGAMPGIPDSNGDFVPGSIGDVNGDGLPDIVVTNLNGLGAYIHQGKRADLLNTVSDAKGGVLRVDHQPISNPQVYSTSGGNCTYPMRCVNRARWVVANYSVNDDTGKWTNYAFKYRNGRVHALRGWLGFEQMTVVTTNGAAQPLTPGVNVARSAVVNYDNVTSFNGAFPFVMRPKLITSGIFEGSTSGRPNLHRAVSIYDYVAVQNKVNGVATNSYAVHLADSAAREEIVISTVGLGILTALPQLFLGVKSSIMGSATNSPAAPIVYDDYNDVTDQTTTSLRGSTERIQTQYGVTTFSDGSVIALPSQVQVTSQSAGTTASQTRTTGFTYYPNTTFLNTVTVEPNGDATVKSTTTLTRGNALGQVTTESVAATATLGETAVAPGAALNRSVTYAYETLEGMYPVSRTNALSQITQLSFHPGLGLLAGIQDPNNVAVTYQYDGFGRLRTRTGGDGRVTTIHYELPPAASTLNSGDQAFYLDASYAVHTTTTGGAETRMVLNHLDHVILEQTMQGGGAWMSTSTRYTTMPGQVAAVTRPHLNTGTIYLSTFGYDTWGRERTQSLPDSTSIIYHDYSPQPPTVAGMRVTTTNPNGNAIDTTYDDLGRLERTHELVTTDSIAAGVDTTYAYGPFNTVTSIAAAQDSAGTPLKTTTLTYDVLGRRLRLVDPDAGTVTRAYNAYSEVITEFSPQVATGLFTTRDVLGRPLAHRLNTFGGAMFDKLVYDTAPNGIGKLASSSVNAAGTTFTPSNTKTYAYDTHGRLTTTTWSQLTGTAAGETFAVDYGFNPSGQLGSITYPAVAGKRLQVSYTYDNAGNLASAARQPQEPRAFWSVVTRDMENRITEEIDGSGVDTTLSYNPARGWLDRSSAVFQADNLKVRSFTYDHDPNGNLLSRSDNFFRQDKMIYNELDQLTQWDHCRAVFDGESITCGLRLRERFIPSSETAAAQGQQAGRIIDATVSFGADINTRHWGYITGGQIPGNGVRTITMNQDTTPSVTLAYSGGRTTKTSTGLTVAYTFFDLPRSVTNASNQVATFDYDADHVRVLKDSRAIPGGAKVTYVGDLYERRTDAAGNVTHVMYVRARDGHVVTQLNWANSGTELSEQYFHEDNIGSVAAITTAPGGGLPTNAAPNETVTPLFYDPWGRPIDSADPTIPVVPATGGVTRGYTGHEMDYELGLVNMRGRMYDPLLMQFLTGDPFTADPGRTRGLNRYVYARGNPFRYTDASGFLEGDSDAGIKDADHRPGGGVQEPRDAGASPAPSAPAPAAPSAPAPTAPSGGGAGPPPPPTPSPGPAPAPSADSSMSGGPGGGGHDPPPGMGGDAEGGGGSEGQPGAPSGVSGSAHGGGGAHEGTSAPPSVPHALAMGNAEQIAEAGQEIANGVQETREALQGINERYPTTARLIRSMLAEKHIKLETPLGRAFLKNFVKAASVVERVAGKSQIANALLDKVGATIWGMGAGLQVAHVGIGVMKVYTAPGGERVHEAFKVAGGIVGGDVGSKVGMAAGVEAGAPGGPVGSAIGAVAGGAVGFSRGEQIGEMSGDAVYEGLQSSLDAVCRDTPVQIVWGP